MLHYQSALLQSLATVFYSVPMVLGFAEEKQIVRINLFEEYVEDSVSVDQYMYIYRCRPVSVKCRLQTVDLGLNMPGVNADFKTF